MDVSAVRGSRNSDVLSMQMVTTIGLDIAKSDLFMGTMAPASSVPRPKPI